MNLVLRFRINQTSHTAKSSSACARARHCTALMTRADDGAAAATS